jgi:hypothetical protein
MTSEDLVKATYPHARLIYDTDRGRFKVRLELAANSKSQAEAWTRAADVLGLTDCTKQQIDEITGSSEQGETCGQPSDKQETQS